MENKEIKKEENTLYTIIDGKRFFENADKKVRFSSNCILYVPTLYTRELSKEMPNNVVIDGNVYEVVYDKAKKRFEVDNSKTYSVETLKVFRPSKCKDIQLTEKADKELEENKSIEFRYKGKDYIITLDENGNVTASANVVDVIAVLTN